MITNKTYEKRATLRLYYLISSGYHWSIAPELDRMIDQYDANLAVMYVFDDIHYVPAIRIAWYRLSIDSSEPIVGNGKHVSDESGVEGLQEQRELD